MTKTRTRTKTRILPFIVLVLVAVLIASSAVSAQSIHVSELQGLYRFENDFTDSAHDNDGNGTSVVFTASKGNNNTGSFSADFNGANPNSVLIDNTNGNFSFNPTLPFSFGAWVNMDDATTFRIGGVRASATNTEYFFTIDGSDLPRFHIHDNSASANLREVGTSTVTADENQWHHWVVTYDGGTISNGLKIYRDAVIITTSSSTSGVYVNMDDTDANLEIGSINNQTAVADGSIDEFFVIKRELGINDITDIYNNGFNLTVIDETSPNINSFSVNNTNLTCNNYIRFQANVTDNINLSSVFFGFDDSDGKNTVEATLDTGDLFIFGKQYIALTSGQTETYNFTNITSIDSSGNKNITTFNINYNYTCSQPDITPPILTLISPSNNTATNIIPLNITFTITDASNNATCVLQNSTEIFDTITAPTGITTGLILEETEIVLDQEFPSLDITCFDNTPANNSALLNINYTLDTNPPVIIPILPINLSSFNTDVVSNIPIQANCSDVPVFRFNITIKNSSDIIATYEDLTPTDNTLQIIEQLSTSGLGEGNYSVIMTCADTHTKNKIRNFKIKKDKFKDKLEWDTGKNKFGIRYDTSNSNRLKSFSSKKSKKGDRYSFDFNINKTKGVLNTYTFIIENTKKIYYLPDSKYKAHFITGDNWIDFEFGDPEASYNVYLNSDNNYVVEITTKKTNLNFQSVGELNINTVATQFELTFTEQIENFFKVTECKTDVGSVLLLSFFIIVSLLLIILGMTTNIGIIGVFGSIMLLVSSWYIIPCISLIGAILTLLSIIFIFLFIFRGFFPSNNGEG